MTPSKILQKYPSPDDSGAPYSVLLVDDQKILRDGIKAILERTAEFRVVAEAENGSSAVSLCGKLAPDLVLMDLRLPGINGIEAIPRLFGVAPVRW